MVRSMDDAVGRLTKALEDTGVAQNTMVVFFSDNGGIDWEPARKEGGKFRYPEEMKLPITSNSPLRACKGTLYEGGVREPCIVSFPGVVKPGTQSEQILSSIDWHPTILELTGVKPQAGLKFDGISMAAALARWIGGARRDLLPLSGLQQRRRDSRHVGAAGRLGSSSASGSTMTTRPTVSNSTT